MRSFEVLKKMCLSKMYSFSLKSNLFDTKTICNLSVVILEAYDYKVKVVCEFSLGKNKNKTTCRQVDVLQRKSHMEQVHKRMLASPLLDDVSYP